MDVHMAWEWEPDGMAAGDFDSVEAAAVSLADSARRMYNRYEYAQRDAMLSCVIPLQNRMRSDGAAAVAAGQSWSSRCGGVRVSLSPRRSHTPP